MIRVIERAHLIDQIFDSYYDVDEVGANLAVRVVLEECVYELAERLSEVSGRSADKEYVRIAKAVHKVCEGAEKHGNKHGDGNAEPDGGSVERGGDVLRERKLFG